MRDPEAPSPDLQPCTIEELREKLDEFQLSMQAINKTYASYREYFEKHEPDAAEIPTDRLMNLTEFALANNEAGYHQTMAASQETIAACMRSISGQPEPTTPRPSTAMLPSSNRELSEMIERQQHLSPAAAARIGALLQQTRHGPLLTPSA